MTKPHVAFFTPLSPQRTGVADYSEELLPYVAEHADIDIVIGDYIPANDHISRQFRIIRPENFAATFQSYDCAIYQIANNIDCHGYMIPFLRRYSGIVVLHDYSLQHLIMGLTLRRGDIASFKKSLPPRFNARADSLAWRHMLSHGDLYEASFAYSIIKMSAGVIVHSNYMANEIQRDVPEKPVKVIPMGVPVGALPSEHSGLRRKHDWTRDDFVLASINTLSYSKRIDLILYAIADLKDVYTRLNFVIIGGGRLGRKTSSLLRKLSLQDVVRRTGWVPADAYDEYIRIADAVIDMRYPSGGETSASLMRALAAGKPLIVSDQGSFTEIPDSCCFKIPVCENQISILKKCILELMQNPEKRRSMATASREYASSNLSLKKAAGSYIDFVRGMKSLRANGDTKGVYASSSPLGIRKTLVSAAYRLFRCGYFLRNYGMAGTLRRVGEEVKGSRARRRLLGARLETGGGER